VTLPADRIGDKGQRFMVVGVNRDTHAVEPIGYCADEDAALELRSAIKDWPRYQHSMVVDRYRPPAQPGYVWDDVEYAQDDEDGAIHYTNEKLFVNGTYAGCVGKYSNWTAFPATGGHASHIRTKEHAMEIVEKHAVVGAA